MCIRDRTDTTWSTLQSMNGNLSLATKTDGTLWMWGYNANGGLGQNNRTSYSSPMQIPGTTWSTGDDTHKATVIGDYAGAAIKTDGTLWVWGYNGYGALGLNQAHEASISSPVQVPGTTWATVHSKWYGVAMATKTDGTLWAWGFNSSYGGLGLNDRTHRSSPTQIPGTTWERVEVMSTHSSIAQRTDGTVWTWGLNQYGQLGHNNLTNYSSPVQLTGTTWRTFTGSRFAMAATKDDGTLWAWGNNWYGSPGTNNTLPHQKSSPVQVGAATNWSSKHYAICGSENYSMSAITVT